LLQKYCCSDKAIFHRHGLVRRKHNEVERLTNRLRQCRRITTRYEKRTANSLAMVTLGMTMLWLT
jgi:transposase